MKLLHVCVTLSEDVTGASYCKLAMPREIVTVQLGQCGNQSISH